MKKVLLSLALVLGASISQAALFEKKDFVGRLYIVNQETGAVQGTLKVREAAKNEKVMGDIVADVDIQVKGNSESFTCAGVFADEEQRLELLCNLTKVLFLKFNNSREDMANYLKGSFGSAEFTLDNRPLTKDSEKISVDVRNLDFK